MKNICKECGGKGTRVVIIGFGESSYPCNTCNGTGFTDGKLGEKIDFWDNDFYMNVALHVKYPIATKQNKLAISISSQDETKSLTHHDIIHAFTLGVIGCSNHAEISVDDFLYDIRGEIKRLQKLQKLQKKKDKKKKD